jgi:acyl-CoA synthetase (AMP-forming)/AMP-acid ligase II
VPINVEPKSVTLKHVIESAKAKVLIIDDEFPKRFYLQRLFEAKRNSWSPLLSSLYLTSNLMEEWAVVLPSITAAFLNTSGTTARSKPCVLSHQYFINQASALVKSFSTSQDDILYGK